MKFLSKTYHLGLVLLALYVNKTYLNGIFYRTWLVLWEKEYAAFHCVFYSERSPRFGHRWEVPKKPKCEELGCWASWFLMLQRPTLFMDRLFLSLFYFCTIWTAFRHHRWVIWWRLNGWDGWFCTEKGQGLRGDRSHAFLPLGWVSYSPKMLALSFLIDKQKRDLSQDNPHFSPTLIDLIFICMHLIASLQRQTEDVLPSASL